MSELSEKIRGMKIKGIGVEICAINSAVVQIADFFEKQPIEAAAPEIAAERDRLKEQNAELLAALELCIETFTHMPEVIGGTSSTAAMRKGRAAIARATGGIR